MSEQVQSAGSDPLHSDVLTAVMGSLKNLAPGAVAPQDMPAPSPTEQVPPQTPTEPSAQPEVPPPPPPPDTRPVVSTDPVGDLSGMFNDRQTPAPEAKPTEAQLPPDTPIPDPEDLQTEKAKNAWQELKQREKASRQYALEMKAQLDEALKGSKLVASERVELANGLKERDDRIKALEDELGKLTLEHQPQFKQKYDAPMQALEDQVVGIIKDATDIESEEQLVDVTQKLMTSTDEAFNRMVSKLPAPVQGSLLDKRSAFRQLLAARDHAVSEWRTTQAGVAAEDEQMQVVQHAERRRGLAEQAIEFTKVTTEPAKRLPILSEPEFAQDVANVDQAFRGFMQEAKDEAIARAAYQGFLMPVVMRQVAFLAEAVEQWRNAYNATRGIRNPPSMAMRVQSSNPEPPAPAAPVIEPGKNFKDTVEGTVAATLRRAGMM